MGCAASTGAARPLSLLLPLLAVASSLSVLLLLVALLLLLVASPLSCSAIHATFLLCGPPAENLQETEAGDISPILCC